MLAAVIGVLGTFIRLVNRTNGTKPQEESSEAKRDPWNGEERRKRDFAQHTLTCPHVAKFEEGIAVVRKDITEGLQAVRHDINQVNTRIDTLIQQERR